MIKIGVGVLALLLAVPVLIGGAVAGMAAAALGGGPGGGRGCVLAAGVPTAPAGYRGDQLANAATIITVGERLGVPERGRVVALAAALQESGLTNLRGGDRDSVGLFQQRPSQGWGTPAQILDPTYAATAFYRHLLAIPGWEAMSVNDAAQAVQRSAVPTAYGPHEPAAQALLTALTGATCTPAGDGTGGDTVACATLGSASAAALVALRFACAARGRPYLWGGSGPGGFDCSGLVWAAYAAAGIPLPRTAQAQYDTGPHLPPGQPIQPGDLVFYGTAPNAVTHVGIAVTAQTMIDAPDIGQLVRPDPIARRGLVGITRPAARRDAR